MKKVKNAALVIAGVIAIIWGSLTISCISDDTAYRIGYDLGSSLSYEGNTYNHWNNMQDYSTDE